MTNEKDPTMTSIEDNVATWRFDYEHASYNPAPPFTLTHPDLKIYVTKAYAPNLTVEQFKMYRENMKKKISTKKQIMDDLSVQVVGHPQADFPTLITKITLPFMFSRRAMINTYYWKDDPTTRGHIAVNSSILNEQLLEEA